MPQLSISSQPYLKFVYLLYQLTPCVYLGGGDPRHPWTVAVCRDFHREIVRGTEEESVSRSGASQQPSGNLPG